MSATRCGDTCIDVTRDPANCGSCGHDCGGATCVDQRCLPETLAVVPNPPSEMALDGADVIFATSGEATSSGALYRVARTGGTPEVLYRGLGAQPSLAVASDAILIAESGQPDACRVSASAGAILSITRDGVTQYSRGRHCARRLIPLDGGLIWLENAAISFFLSNEPIPWIARLSNGAAPDEPPVALYQTTQFGVQDLVQGGSTLIWREFAGQSTLLSQMPITGGAAHPIRSFDATPGTYGINRLYAFSADSEQLVYVWHSASDFHDHVVLRSLATGVETTVADLDGGAEQVIFDASFVYWIADRNVWALDLVSGNRQRLTEDGTAREILQDDRFLYALQWNTRSREQTRVSRIRKPEHIGQATSNGPEVCAAPFVECSTGEFGGRICVDVAQDPDHCGDCTTTCGLAETCARGTCVCAAPGGECGGGCVDLATDAANCGRCGRSCGGGACRGGDCTPVQIGEFAQATVQDANALYYAVGRTVKRLDKQSATVTTLGHFMYARDLAVDATHLYVVETSGSIGISNPGTIYALAGDGSGVSAPLYRDRPNPRQIAAAGDEVLWVEDAGETTATPSTLVHAAADGSAIRGSLQPIGLYPGAADDQSRDVAVDGSVVYWLLGDESGHGAIVRVDLSAASASPVLVTTLDRDPAALTVMNGRIYVTTRGLDGALLSISTAGGQISVLETGLFDADAVESTADGSVYWLDGDFDARVVHQLAPGAATSRAIEKAPTNASATLLFDGDRLYTASPEGIFVVTR